jgi:hypothetical protein
MLAWRSFPVLSIIFHVGDDLKKHTADLDTAKHHKMNSAWNN